MNCSDNNNCSSCIFDVLKKILILQKQDFDDDFKNEPKEGINPYDLGNDNKKQEGDSAQKNNFEDDFDI